VTPSIVWDDVPVTVITPLPLFFIIYCLPVTPTAVGKVTVKVPVVQSTV